jgi:DNA-binding LytR/AlgR family response regulator
MDLRAVLVDDEQLARDELGYLLGRVGGVEVIGQAGNGLEALTTIDRLQPDVVFLDVQMPGLTGFEVARRLVDEGADAHIIFVTAFDQHAIEAFEVNAVDYLLKPVDPARLARVLDRLRERTRDTTAPVEKVPVVAGGGTELLDYDQIHYAQADGDYSRVHTYDRSYLCTASLGELEEKLPGGRFARIHRSYIVNLAKVAGVRRAAPDRFRLQLADAEKTELDVARRQSRQLRERLGL